MMLESFKSNVLPLKNKLFRYANSILGDYDLSKDVVQETLIKTWEKRHDFDKVKNIEAWCMTIARNFSLDKMRSKHHKTMGLIGEYDKAYEFPSPYQIAETQSTMEVIDWILEKMPLKQKETFQLRDVEGLSYQEICSITGYSINDVKVSIFRARSVIRKTLLKLESHELEKRNAS